MLLAHGLSKFALETSRLGLQEEFLLRQLAAMTGAGGGDYQEAELAKVFRIRAKNAL